MSRAAPIHPVVVRFTHWVNALAVLIMIGSGWQIYNASPIFLFRFPIGLGGWLGGALLWHFAAMWILMVNGLLYLAYGFASGRFLHKLLPIRPRDVVADLLAALKGKLVHADLSVYNAVQRLLYLGVIAALIVVTLSGLAVWKPIQLWWLTALCAGFQGARLVHFLAMAAIVGFLAVHIGMALLVPKSLKAMVIGR
jgi:thiosulfate reductase cytochrome b subunit